MNAFEFLQMGFRVALMPSSLSLAALEAARETCFSSLNGQAMIANISPSETVPPTEVWYKKLGSTRKLV
jgi:hypothetical protein